MKILVGVLANDENGYDEMVQAARDTCYKNIPEEFDASVFDKILEERKYIDYIKEYGVDELITFGGEFIK